MGHSTYLNELSPMFKVRLLLLGLGLIIVSEMVIKRFHISFDRPGAIVFHFKSADPWQCPRRPSYRLLESHSFQNDSVYGKRFTLTRRPCSGLDAT